MNLGDNLKKIRKEQHLSQEQLAEKLGVSRQSISKWECGEAYPELDKVLQLCELFHVNADALLNQDIKKINENKQSKINMNKYIDDFLDYVTKTVDMFSSMKWKEKIKCIFEQGIILFCLLIIFVIFGTIGSALIRNLSSLLPDFLYVGIYNMTSSVYILICLILGSILLFHIFKVRYLDYYEIIREEKKDFSENQDVTEINEKKNVKKVFLEKKKEKIIIRDDNHSGYKFISGLFRFFLWIIKVVLFCFGIGFCLCFVTLVFLAVLSFLFVKTGILFFGALMVLLSCMIVNLIVLYFIYDFLLNQKCQKGRCAIFLLISLIFIGIGSAFITIGISKFDYIDCNQDESYFITKTEEIEMKENLVIHEWYDYPIEYIESDQQNIKIEYLYSKYYDIQLLQDNDVYSIHYYASDNFSTSKIIQKYIEDINHFKIVDYSDFKITIYTSKENIQKLKQNLSDYYLEAEQKELVNEYEEKIRELEENIEILQEKNEQLEMETCRENS